MTDKPKLSHEEYLHAKMVANAMQASGVIGTLEAQIQDAIKSGKVTIAQAGEDRRTMAANAARTMAMGIEAALRTLNEEGYQIVRVEKASEYSSHGTGSIPATGNGETPTDGLPAGEPG